MKHQRILRSLRKEVEILPASGVFIMNNKRIEYPKSKKSKPSETLK